MERVVVTGMGVASPLGCTVADFWAGLLEGRSGIVELQDEMIAKQRSHIGGVVSGFDALEYFGRKGAHRMSRSSHLAIVAADQAVAQAGLNAGNVDKQEVGVLISSSNGGYAASDPFFRDFYARGTFNPFTIPIVMNVGPSSNISIKYGFKGPLINLDAACSSAAHAVGYGYYLIRSGQLDVAITGAADTPLSPGVVAAWCALRALSERNDSPAQACRPFSADRDGLVLGEGAGVLILESETSALRRGRPILAEVIGYGASGDGHHLTQPAVDGPVRAMRKALNSAALSPDDIDYINAHGTGTQWNDKTETAAIKEVFGERAYRIPVVSNKAALGHSIAASGALELIGGILSLRDQVLPPTINYTTPDPECDLDYVTEGRRPRAIRTIMSNSFAFGGSNGVLVVRKYESSP